MIVLDIIHNIALLVVLSVAYGLLSERMPAGTLTHRAVSGLLFGGVFIDREQRRRTRRALAESEERFYGWSREQLTSMRAGEINTSGAEEIQAELMAARRAERQHFEFRHRRADGSVRDVEIFSGTGFALEQLLYRERGSRHYPGPSPPRGGARGFDSGEKGSSQRDSHAAL